MCWKVSKLDIFTQELSLYGKSEIVITGVSNCSTPVFLLTKIVLPVGVAASIQPRGRPPPPPPSPSFFLSLLSSNISSKETKALTIRDTTSPVMPLAFTALLSTSSSFPISSSNLQISSGPSLRKFCWAKNNYNNKRMSHNVHVCVLVCVIKK